VAELWGVLEDGPASRAGSRPKGENKWKGPTAGWALATRKGLLANKKGMLTSFVG
jgi:hypothetical protein